MTVTSYAMLARLPEMALERQWRWSLVVADEAHEYLRTPTTKVGNTENKKNNKAKENDFVLFCVFNHYFFRVAEPVTS